MLRWRHAQAGSTHHTFTALFSQQAASPPLCCACHPPHRLPCLCRRGQTSPYQPAISPEPVGHLAQHRLLPLLVEAVRQQPAIDLRMGHRWGRSLG